MRNHFPDCLLCILKQNIKNCLRLIWSMKKLLMSRRLANNNLNQISLYSRWPPCDKDISFTPSWCLYLKFLWFSVIHKGEMPWNIADFLLIVWVSLWEINFYTYPRWPQKAMQILLPYSRWPQLNEIYDMVGCKALPYLLPLLGVVADFPLCSWSLRRVHAKTSACCSLSHP